MLKNQNYRCSICNKHEEKFKYKLAVDHCHLTGEIRGLLCNNCNAGLGLFNDSEFSLKAAIKYLNR